ncbi:MAG: rRNA maturation RNase YbeY [Planctomycetales bacterium]|nr:rRNA maturation RNase YbeY [Planctomycetales bacterium]
MITVDVVNEQSALAVDDDQIRRVIEAVFAEQRDGGAAICVVLVDDATIHQLNRQFLDHDWPTDVLSFVLDNSAGELDGELVVSTETAIAQATAYGHDANAELLLYVVHGALHLVGFDDCDDGQRAQMRERESYYLSQFGLEIPSGAQRDVVTDGRGAGSRISPDSGALP